MKNGTPKTCSRGHKFHKCSDCPVCPVCWSGYYRDKNQGDFPAALAAPALRALLNAKIFTLSKLAQHTEAEVAQFHGIGVNAIKVLKSALKAKALTFKEGR